MRVERWDEISVTVYVFTGVCLFILFIFIRLCVLFFVKWILCLFLPLLSKLDVLIMVILTLDVEAPNNDDVASLQDSLANVLFLPALLFSSFYLG